MHIAPGWYGVNGTSEVRWWDGAKFRTILLRNGVVTYEKAKSQQPSMSYVMGAVMVVLGLTRLANPSRNSFDVAFAVLFFLLGIFSFISAVLGQQVEKLPAPTMAPYADPSTMPWPGHTEPGPIPAGWYSAPSAKMPRWWTGARWGEYINLRQHPIPVAGQRARMVTSMWLVISAFAILSLLGLGLLVVGAREDVSAMALTGGILLGVFVVMGVALSLYSAHLVKVYTMPTMPPGYSV